MVQRERNYTSSEIIGLTFLTKLSGYISVFKFTILLLPFLNSPLIIHPFNLKSIFKKSRVKNFLSVLYTETTMQKRLLKIVVSQN